MNAVGENRTSPLGPGHQAAGSAETVPDRRVLDVNGLTIVFHTQDGVVHAVNGVSFSLDKGELLAIVGESGSGKSVAMMSLMQLLPMPPAEVVSGKVLFQGRDLLSLDASGIRQVRGARIGFVFQDPLTSLNPVFTVGYQIMEPLREHLGMNRRQARQRAIELLELVGIPAAEQRIDDYPHLFSGGMRQRIVIAVALACDPDVLIADEPTTALDVTVQAQILELVRDLRQRLDMAIIWITHDLAVAAGIADRVMVMYSGLVVEHARVEALFETPRHPYTRALLDALPMRHTSQETLRSIAGQPPLLMAPPDSCPFAPRCSHAFDRCREENPDLAKVGPDQEVACWWEPPPGGPRDGS